MGRVAGVNDSGEAAFVTVAFPRIKRLAGLRCRAPVPNSISPTYARLGLEQLAHLDTWCRSRYGSRTLLPVPLRPCLLTPSAFRRANPGHSLNSSRSFCPCFMAALRKNHRAIQREACDRISHGPPPSPRPSAQGVREAISVFRADAARRARCPFPRDQHADVDALRELDRVCCAAGLAIPRRAPRGAPRVQLESGAGPSSRVSTRARRARHPYEIVFVNDAAPTARWLCASIPKPPSDSRGLSPAPSASQAIMAGFEYCAASAS